MPVVSGSGVPPNPRYSTGRAEAPAFNAPVRDNPRPARTVEGIRPRPSFWPSAFVIFWLIAAGVLYFCWLNGVFSSIPTPRTQPVAGKQWRCDLGYSYCPEDLWKRAEGLIKEKRWGEAAQLLDVALNQAPRQEICRNFRKIMALCLVKSGDHRRAITELQGVIKDGGADDGLYHQMGHAYAGVGSYEKAINAFKEAIRLNPLAKHYVCGARLIIKAANQDVNLKNYLPLARQWSDQAASLEGKSKELEAIRSALQNQIVLLSK